MNESIRFSRGLTVQEAGASRPDSQAGAWKPAKPIIPRLDYASLATHNPEGAHESTHMPDPSRRIIPSGVRNSAGFRDFKLDYAS